MSQTRAKHDQGVPTALVICPVCQAEVDEPRCPSCGAAIAPGGYQIERLIAQTPHSRVYAARGADGNRVALKELVFALIPDAHELDAFEREAQILHQLSHPRIPRFLQSFREGEGAQMRLYLAQELIEGQSLADQLESHRFDEVECRQIAREVLEVLGYLHGLSPMVLHRDVKPANLIRRSDGQLFLVDFGAARDLAGTTTHSATVVGTFGYMPPEQLGGTIDETCDFYALGATLAHLLSRKPPAELLGPDMGLNLKGQVHVSPTFLKWLERMVQPRRDHRFATAQQALAALGGPAEDRIARKLAQSAKRVEPDLKIEAGGDRFVRELERRGQRAGAVLRRKEELSARAAQAIPVAPLVNARNDDPAAWFVLFPMWNVLWVLAAAFCLSPVLPVKVSLAIWVGLPSLILISLLRFKGFLRRLPFQVSGWEELVSGKDVGDRDQWREVTINVLIESKDHQEVVEKAVSSALAVFALKADRRFYRRSGTGGDRTEWKVSATWAHGSANSRVVWQVYRFLRGDLSRIASRLGGVYQVNFIVAKDSVYVGEFVDN